NGRNASPAGTTLLHSLVVPEEKQAITHDRSTCGSTILIAADNARLARRVKPIAGVQLVFHQEVVHRAVDIIGAALGQDLNLGIGVSSELCVEVVGDQLEFLDRVRAKGFKSGLSGGNDVGRDNVVDRDVVSAATPSVAVEASSVEKRIAGRD